MAQKKPLKEKFVRVSYRFPVEIDNRVREHCSKTNQIMTGFIINAIEDRLKLEEKRKM